MYPKKNNHLFFLILFIALVINSNAQSLDKGFKNAKRVTKLNTFVQKKFDYGRIMEFSKHKDFAVVRFGVEAPFQNAYNNSISFGMGIAKLF